jgi:hypothetical protein
MCSAIHVELQCGVIPPKIGGREAGVGSVTSAYPFHLASAVYHRYDTKLCSLNSRHRSILMSILPYVACQTVTISHQFGAYRMKLVLIVT